MTQQSPVEGPQRCGENLRA
jgi:hypothetical protein